MGDLVQEDGHGGQEPNLQEGECVGVCARGQGTDLSTQPTNTCCALAGHHLVTRSPAASQPALVKLTVWRAEARAEQTKNREITHCDSCGGGRWGLGAMGMSNGGLIRRGVSKGLSEEVHLGQGQG